MIWLEMHMFLIRKRDARGPNITLALHFESTSFRSLGAPPPYGLSV